MCQWGTHRWGARTKPTCASRRRGSRKPQPPGTDTPHANDVPETPPNGECEARIAARGPAGISFAAWGRIAEISSIAIPVADIGTQRNNWKANDRFEPIFQHVAESRNGCFSYWALINTALSWQLCHEIKLDLLTQSQRFWPCAAYRFHNNHLMRECAETSAEFQVFPVSIHETEK